MSEWLVETVLNIFPESPESTTPHDGGLGKDQNSKSEAGGLVSTQSVLFLIRFVLSIQS